MGKMMRSGGALLALQLLISIICSSADKIVFFEPFDKDFSTGERWVVSQKAEYSGVWKHSAPPDTEDFGLEVSEKARRYAIAAALPEAVDHKKDTLVLQYDLRLRNGWDCGGAYIKFLMPQDAGWTANEFDASSPYSIMFGPDKCGSTNKVHFIFRYKSPVTGEYIEHHLKTPPFPPKDELTHAYTAIVYTNNTVKILIDGEEKKIANLLSSTDFDPPVVPPKMISDPEDKKPADWEDKPKIADPVATKPEDWDEDQPKMMDDEEAVKPEGWLDDEPLQVDDPEAAKPEDWDESEDGEWEPPSIPNEKCAAAPGCGEWVLPKKANPAYKGKWKAPLVDNPAYKGVWKAREIPNPGYFELDRVDLEPVAALGIEIWTMNDGILFDNILVTDDEGAAEQYRETTWKPKFDVEGAKEKEKQAAEKKKEKKAAGTTGPKQLKQFKEIVFDNFHKLVNLPFLEPVRPSLQQALHFLESKDEYAYGLIAGLMLLLILIIYLAIPGKKKKQKKVTLEQAKKEDISSPDDDVAESAPIGEASGSAAVAEKAQAEEAMVTEASAEEPAGAPRRRTTRRET